MSTSERGQRGTVMVLVITILAALLAGAAVALYLQLSSTRAAGYTAWSRGSLYCAEAGLAAARPLVGENYAVWPALIDTDSANDPAWYPLIGDIDDPPDGQPDYIVTVRDNDDEFPPLANDPTRDNDLQVFIVSTCTKYSDTPTTVLELVTYQGAGTVYRDQSGGGSGNTGNQN